MGGPSKERQWGETIRRAEQRARETRFAADVAACDAWEVPPAVAINFVSDIRTSLVENHGLRLNGPSSGGERYAAAEDLSKLSSRGQ
jgi:hypothetical protein